MKLLIQIRTSTRPQRSATRFKSLPPAPINPCHFFHSDCQKQELLSAKEQSPGPCSAMVLRFRRLVSHSNSGALAYPERRQLLAVTLLLLLLCTSLRVSDCSGSAATGPGAVSFAANSASSEGEFQAPALDPGGWEVKKFEQVQRCLACRFVQETAVGNTDELAVSSKDFGQIMLKTCPSLPSFLRPACNDASAAINRMQSSAAHSDICHSSSACSVPLLDPFETAKLLASACEPSRCTIYHHVSRSTPTA